MPTRNRNFLRVLVPFGFLAVAVFAFIRRKSDDWEYETADDDAAVRAVPLVLETGRRRSPAARLALVAAFTSLFFAGAAFTAGAGDQLAKMLDPDDAAALQAADDDAAAAAAQATAEAAPAAPEVAAPEVATPAVAPPAVATPEVAAPELAAPEAAPEVVAPAVAPAAPAGEPAAAAAALGGEVAAAADNAVTTEAAPLTEPSAVVAANPVGPRAASSQAATAIVGAAKLGKPVAAKADTPATKRWVLERAAAPAPEPEIDVVPGYGEPTIWLNRALPDPTPPSARLTRTFAHQLVSASKSHGADWAAVLGVLRAQGERGSVPASITELDTIAARLGKQKAWRGALALSGRTGFADSAEALADLYRAVGIETLITGYEASKDRLAKRLLGADDVWIYGGGRDDIAAGRIDVRILVVITYLKQRHGSVTVSCLFAGHRKFSRPGVVSAHTYGHAVDVAAVGEISIAGHQQPGGITEAAVRSLLLLPTELQPQQVISLLGLGGPSFPLRDHGDHIHVGF